MTSLSISITKRVSILRNLHPICLNAKPSCTESLLSLQELTSLALYKAKCFNNITRDGHKAYCDIFTATNPEPPLDIRTIERLLQRSTGIAHVRYDCCKNNCVCF